MVARDDEGLDILGLGITLEFFDLNGNTPVEREEITIKEGEHM